MINNISLITITDEGVTQSEMDGVAGIEPANGGIKIHCLTTWLHPKFSNVLKFLK